MTIEYTSDIQKLFLRMMLQHPENYARVQNIFNVENFDKSLQKSAKFIAEHCEKHRTMPTFEQINAVSSIDIGPINDMNQGHDAWFLSEFESFSRRQEMERAILQSADLIEQNIYDPVEKIIKDAIQISITKDTGTDYFYDPKTRLLKLKDNNGQIPTGWSALDDKLFGGMNKGELNIFAGGSGSGKSLFLQNLAINWVLAGYNGIYITLELSEELAAMRMDSMITDIPTANIFKNLDNVEMKVKMTEKESGKLQLKYLPAQSNINDIRAFIKEFELNGGYSADFILIDYLDLMVPASVKTAPGDLYVKDKYVSEELRNMAKELNCIAVSASQLNRSSVEEIEFDHSHIAGGISKINTADNVFGIYTSRSLREKGIYQVQLMKTRSSNGVGTKVDLGFDINNLRITSLPKDQMSSSEMQSEKLKNILNKMRK